MLLTVYSVVYSVIVAVSTTALYLAYGIPIYLMLRNKLGKKGEIFMFIYWQLDAKKRFKGPTPADEAELRTIEHDLQEAAHPHHAG